MPKLLKAGDVIELKQGHTVYADVPEHFAYSNKRGVFDKTAHAQARIGGELEFLAGQYIVTHTTLNGGGTGMGPHDVYPDGHHVYCERPHDKRKVDFYQTGAFTAMIPEIEPIGRAELRYEVVEYFADKRVAK